MIYLTAIGLPTGDSSTVHIYTKTIHRKTKNKQYIEQHKHLGRVRAVPRLGELYPGICLTTEENHGKPYPLCKVCYLSFSNKHTVRRCMSRLSFSVFLRQVISILSASFPYTYVSLTQEFQKCLPLHPISHIRDLE
jgi:hypothetical protein